MTNSITKMKLMLLALCATFITSQKESISPYEEMKKFVKTFKPRGMNASRYYLLSIDEKHNNLVVGARNNVFLVNLDDMKSYVYWNAPQQPGDNAFVKMMLPFGDRILLCWVEKPSTGSCTWRNRTTLGEAPESNQGYVFKSKEKYNAPSSSPDQNDTAIITEDGTLFVGTFLPVGGYSIIYSKRFRHPQLKEVFSARWSSFYEDVHFVKSFEIGPYVYFFFRERSLECYSCGKVNTSRVARVCKGDQGGCHTLLNTFVTFQKAKLTCTDVKNYALNFIEIQDVWWDNRTGQFYAAFSSQSNGPAISAICIYSLSSINRIFNESDFKSFTSEAKSWTKRRNKIGEYFPGCKVNPKYLKSSSSVADGVMATEHMLSSAYGDLTHDPLVADGVDPVGLKAWFIRNGIRMTGISLDVVGQNIVVYASTDRGSVMKFTQPRGISQPCFYSEMEVYPSYKKEVIKTMVIDQVRHVLYLGTRYSLTQLSLDQCERYQHDKSACISGADPYCGWDDKTFRCSSVRLHGETPQQDLKICPKERKVDLTVGWEGERSWEILGVQHGNWSAWGYWSECSTETWAGVRSRSRACTNPLPRRGGRTCAGDSMQYEPCSLENQGVDCSWDVWSSCICDHGLNLAEKGSGVMYRDRKCCSTYPNEPSCANSVQFKTCFCKRPTSVLGRQQVPHSFESSGTRTVIGVTVGIVVLAVSFVAVLYYFKHKRKDFHVFKTDENNSHDAGSESKFSTLPSATDESLKEPLSPSASPGKRDRKRSPKIKLPMKNFLPKRMRETSRCSVDCV